MDLEGSLVTLLSHCDGDLLASLRALRSDQLARLSHLAVAALAQQQTPVPEQSVEIYPLAKPTRAAKERGDCSRVCGRCYVVRCHHSGPHDNHCCRECSLDMDAYATAKRMTKRRGAWGRWRHRESGGLLRGTGRF